MRLNNIIMETIRSLTTKKIYTVIYPKDTGDLKRDILAHSMSVVGNKVTFYKPGGEVEELDLNNIRFIREGAETFN